jgi:hypothetical protein
MKDIEREFSTGDFGIWIEEPARVAFVRLERETRGMGGGELAELARRLAGTRRALVAAGYRVRYVDEGRCGKDKRSRAGKGVGPTIEAGWRR